jgi:U3 small nucleolar RNA-associated protein 20
MPLNTDNIRNLLQLVTVSIMDITSQFQNSAFQLIKVLVETKVILPEMYDLMDKLMQQIVLSHRKNVRESASGVIIAFMLGYPLGTKRFQQVLKQLLANCSYEFEDGRIAALNTLATVVRLIPIQALEDSAQMVFLPMTLRAVNDNSPACREAACDVIEKLARKVPAGLFAEFTEYGFKWLGRGVAVCAQVR